jgi:hypothetical protein
MLPPRRRGIEPAALERIVTISATEVGLDPTGTAAEFPGFTARMGSTACATT